MPQRNHNRNNRAQEDDNDDDYEGARMRPRREYDEREREFLQRSRRRDEGNYGRAYGSEQFQRRYDDFEGERFRSRGGDSGVERGRSSMGWGRGEDDEPGPRREGGERRGYWSQSERGEFSGEDDYARSRGRGYGTGPRGYDDDDSGGSYRGRRDDMFRGGRGRFEDEDDQRRGSMDDEDRFGSRGRSGHGGGRQSHFEDKEGRSNFRGGRQSQSEDDESRSNYRGGRHVGGNIGQGQMDYNEEGYRRGGRGSSYWAGESETGGRRGGVRGGSRWEDEDVQTSGRGGRGSFGTSLISDLDEEDRSRGGRTSRRESGTGRGRSMGREEETSRGRSRVSTTKRKKRNTNRDESDGA